MSSSHSSRTSHRRASSAKPRSSIRRHNPVRNKSSSLRAQYRRGDVGGGNDDVVPKRMSASMRRRPMSAQVNDGGSISSSSVSFMNIQGRSPYMHKFAQTQPSVRQRTRGRTTRTAVTPMSRSARMSSASGARSSSSPRTNDARVSMNTAAGMPQMVAHPDYPGELLLRRAPDDDKRERLNLDRRQLEQCVHFENEGRLRLLNYEHNRIAKIEHLHGLHNLIFLDLYDNEIEHLSGFDDLKSLRVLMAGKNKIRKIEGLESLVNLDVLDLHSNQIQTIENLTNQGILRVLNLAGNCITRVENVSALSSLTELNLRRNKICGFGVETWVPGLQRLFLSNNELTSMKQMEPVFLYKSLNEISLEGNLVSRTPLYRLQVLQKLPELHQIDLVRVSPTERSRALNWNPVVREHNRKASVPSQTAQSSMSQRTTFASLHRVRGDAAAAVVMDKPELLPHTEKTKTSSSSEVVEAPKQETSPKNIVVPSPSLLSTNTAIVGDSDASVDRVQPMFKYEHANATLLVFGDCTSALEQVHKYAHCECVTFEHVNIQRIVPYVKRVRRLSKLKRLCFRDNNIRMLGQFDPFSVLPVCDIVVLDNPICGVSILQSYIIAMFSSLQTFNGHSVTLSDRGVAKKRFSVLMTQRLAHKKSSGGCSVEVAGIGKSLIEECAQVKSRLQDVNTLYPQAVQQVIHKTVEQLLDPEELYQSMAHQLLQLTATLSQS